MEGDRAVGNDKELTSTNTRSSSGNGNSSMEEILSSTKQKGESGTNDTLPTSSTDASTSVKSLHLVSDDPISSTSSEMDSAKTNVNNSTNNVVDKTCSTFDTEAELLEMSIGIQTCEKIEENVDDLVNDLETLLGESTDSFTTTVKPAGVIKEKIEEKKKCDADVQDKVREKTTEIAVGVIDLQEPGPSKDSRAPDCVDTNNSDSIVEKTDPHEQNDQKITGTFASEDQQKTIEETKPVPEINIRRKTVEQDLEKVVCLSEESSDSDANGAVSIPHKQSETNEDTDLIKIAEAADEMPDPEVTEGDAIEEFLSLPPEVESAAEPADSGSNLETILAVASLENESVSDNVRVERRLSEKEIQEMEAIRMAVASITDSSQDTYDSFLVENSVAIDSCVQEASENVQQCPMTTEKQFPNATLLISSSADSPADDLSKEDSDNIADTGISGKSKFADDNAEAGDVRNSRFDDDSKGISEVIEDNDGDNIVLESAEVSKEVLSSEEGFQETVSQVAENKGDDIKMDNQTLDPPAPESICVRETGTMSKEETEDTAKGYCAANTLSTVEIMHCNPSEVGSLKLQPKEEVKCATQESSSFITEENKISLEMELNLCQTTIELNSDDADTAGEVTSLKMASEAAGGTKEHDEDIVEKEIFKTETTEQFVEAKDEVTCNESTTSETDETMKKTETTVLEESNTLPCKKVDEESKLNIPKNVINTDHIDMPASDLTVEEKQVNNATIELFDKPTDTAPPSCGEATDIVEETKVERTEDMEVLDKETPEEVANEGGSLLQNAVPEKEESDKGEVPEAIIVEGDEMSPLATDDPTSPEQLGTTELQEVCPVLSKETVENVTDKTDENVEGNAIVSETVSGVVMESVVRNDDDDGHTTGSDEIKLVHKETENVDHQEGVLLENEGQFTKNKEKSPDKNEPMKQDTAIGDCLPVNQTVEEEIVLETSHVKEDEKVTSPKEVCQEDDLPKHEIIIAEENPKMAAEEVVIPEHDGSASEEIIKEDEEMSTPKGTAEDNNSDSKKHIEGNVKLETVTIDSDRIEIRSESNVDKPIESSTSVSVAAEDENTESESKPLLKLQENDSDEVQISEQKDALNSPEKTGVDEEMDINTQNVADQKPATDLPNEGLDKQLNKGNAELGVPKNSATAELVAGVSNISEEAVKGDDLTILKPLEDSSENKDEIKALVADSNSGLTSECMAQAGDDNNQKTVENSKEISEEIAMQHSIEVSELLSKNDSSDVEQLVKENSVEIEGNQELITEESQAENNLSVTKCIAAIEDGENNELPTPDEDAADERRDENNLSALKGVEDRETIAEENILSVSKAIDDVGAPETLELPVSEQKIAEEKENSLAASEGIDDVEAEERIELPVSEEHIAEERSLRSRTRRGNKVSEPLSINVEGMEKKDKVYSPKITIKPVKVPDEEVSTTSDVEGNKGSLKMTITKQSDKMRSILKVFSPEDDVESTQSQDEPIPKLIIKPKMQQVEQQHSPKMTTRSSKTYSPTNTRCSSPRVSIKPVPKPPEANSEILSPLKITFKPVVKPEEVNKRSPKALKEQDQKNVNPKITIKPIPKPSEVDKEETAITTPKVIIKPIKRHLEEDDAENVPERSSPKITIKPVIKIDEQDSDQLSNTSTPKLKIKPIKKQDDPETGLEKDEGSPKISIKPLVKPPEHLEEDDEEVKERIVLKINKGNLPTPTKDPKKREYPEDDKSEKVGIKLKFSTTGGHTHIVQDGEDNNKRQRKDSGYSSGAAKKDVEETPHKRASDEKLPDKNKRLRSALTPDTIEDNISQKVNAPIIINENLRFQHSSDFATAPDPLPDIAKIADLASQTTHIEATSILTVGIATPSASPAKKRGRPRKAHLEVREEFKDPTSSQAALVGHPQGTPVAGAPSNPASDSGTPVATPSPSEGRPKRSCRGQNVIATLGIKPRKPRGGGRGRGSKVNMGDRESPVVQPPTESVQAVAVTPEKVKNKSKKKKKKSRRRSKSS